MRTPMLNLKLGKLSQSCPEYASWTPWWASTAFSAHNDSTNAAPIQTMVKYPAILGRRRTPSAISTNDATGKRKMAQAKPSGNVFIKSSLDLP